MRADKPGNRLGDGEQIRVVGEDNRDVAAFSKGGLDCVHRELNINALLHRWLIWKGKRVTQWPHLRHDKVSSLCLPRCGLPSICGVSSRVMFLRRQAAMDLNAGQFGIGSASVARSK